ncbi:MAG: hypothetical protein KDC98_16590 [Planctomycetes bacterium]|nr:hypothetical protein [Planctomycetota bacterium]
MRGIAIFTAALLLCLLLPQRTLHGVDGNTFVVWIESHDLGNYARHAAYLHLCGLVYGVIEPFGGGGYLALRVASALGTALGLVFLHRAFHEMMPSHARTPLAATIAVFVTPACFYYATSAEIPGVFFAGAGACWWAFARWLQRPTALRAAAIGVAAAIAGAIHSFGHLISPSLLLTALLLRRLPQSGRTRHGAAMLATHAAIALLLSLLLASGAGSQTADAVGHLEERWQTFAPFTAPTVLWREWILAYLPWSIGTFLALCAANSRPWALAALAMLALHLPLNVLLLGFHDINERGAYLIALAPAAVLATAWFVTARGFRLAIVASAVLTVLAVSPGWYDPVPPDFGAGIEQLNGEQRIALVVSTQAEMDGARTAVRGLMAIDLRMVIGAYVDRTDSALSFAQWFDGWHDTLMRGGMVPVLSASSAEFFATVDDLQLRAFWRDHVPQRYESREVRRLGFSGVMLTRR